MTRHNVRIARDENGRTIMRNSEVVMFAIVQNISITFGENIICFHYHPRMR